MNLVVRIALSCGEGLVIPNNLKEGLLQQLQNTHMDISKTKSLARGYFW